MRDIETLLFETEAIRVAPEDRPFWYTSGTLGPFYCNTHFLFGGEEAAGELLSLIDGALAREDRTPLPCAIANLAGRRFASGGAYREAVDAMTGYLAVNVDMDGVGVISGGERRDWFFSYAAAVRFGKAHLTIFKDRSALYTDADPLQEAAGGLFVISSAGTAGSAGTTGTAGSAGAAKSTQEAPSVGSTRAASAADLAGRRVLHVCDLVTEASSFKRAWAPALERLGARIGDSLAIVDRLQGGGEALASLGIRHHALATIDAGLFGRALAAGRIDARQHRQLLRYIADPNGAMRAFMAERPRFIEDAIASGGKDAERARLCLESGVYRA